MQIAFSFVCPCVEVCLRFLLPRQYNRGERNFTATSQYLERDTTSEFLLYFFQCSDHYKMK